MEDRLSDTHLADAAGDAWPRYVDQRRIVGINTDNQDTRHKAPHMATRSFFRNDFPRLWYVVFGALIGTNALFNRFSEPMWVTLNVLIIAGSFGLAIVNAVGLFLRPRSRKHTVSETPDQ